MKAANLLPADRRGGAKRPARTGFLTRQPLLVAAVVLALVAAVALGYLAHSARSDVSSRQAEVTSLDAQIAKLAPKPAGDAAAAAQLSAVTATAAARNSWDGFLWSLSRVVPEDVWLLNLSGTLPPPPVPGALPATPAPNGFTMTGYTYSQPSVARLMRRLQLLPWLNGVNLVTSTKSQIGNYTVYQFTVGANLLKLPEVGS